MDFKRITLSETGTMAWTREYEVLRTVRGMQATLYEGSWRYNKLETRKSCQTGQGTWGKSEYERFAKKLDDLKVASWDGYSGNDPNALDGSSFSLEIVTHGGKILHAGGCNAWPKGYREFVDAIEEAVFGPKEY